MEIILNDYHKKAIDVQPNKVLVDNDDHLYFIDTIIYPSDTDGWETY